MVFFNQAMDLRAAEMMSYDEGWFTDRLEADLVANQKEYTVPEGSDRIRRIVLQYDEGSLVYEIPLMRDEKWFTPTVQVGSNVASGPGYVPTVRLVGELLYLEPAPTQSRTNGIIIEMEALPDRLTEGGSKLDLKFPAVTDTLLVYDAWDIALGVEDAQGNINPEVRGRLQNFHRKFEKAFHELISNRYNSPHFSTPWYLGD